MPAVKLYITGTLDSAEATWAYTESSLGASATVAVGNLLSAARTANRLVVHAVESFQLAVVSTANSAKAAVVANVQTAERWVTVRQDYGPPALTSADTQTCTAMAYKGYKPGPTTSKGWEVLKSSDPSEEPFGWVLLQRFGKGKHVLAFRGTDEAVDWLDNFEVSGGGLPWQFNPKALPLQFAKAAKLVSGMNQENLIVTGHSLGGGLACFTSILFGIPGTAINAKPLLGPTLSYLALHAKRPIIIRFCQYDDKNDVVHRIPGWNPGETCVVTREIDIQLTDHDRHVLALAAHYDPLSIAPLLLWFKIKYGPQFILTGHEVGDWTPKMPMVCKY